MAARSRQLGFTVTELVITVAIVGLLAAIAAPNMGAMIRKQRIKTAAFDVFSTLSFARSEAIKRNTSVTITPTGGSWSSGWRITDSNGTLLRSQGGWETLTATGPATVIYGSSGRLSAPVTPISLSASGADASAQRCVTIDPSGRATTKEGAC